MSEAKAITLEHRGLLRIGGADWIEFLQGIVSNDVARVSPAQSLWSAFLTPQGKYLHEFFLLAEGDSLMIAAAGAPSLVLYSRDSDPAKIAPRGPVVKTLRRESLSELTLEEVLTALPGKA